MQKKCQNCKKEFEAKSNRAKYCSAKCRVAASRDRDPAEDNPDLESEDRIYRFRTYNKRADEWSEVREATTWVDVPLAGEPVLEDDWPEKPDYMNNREYYLWWDNHFKTNDKGSPIITNPHPVYDNLTYQKASEQSRRWGS